MKKFIYSLLFIFIGLFVTDRLGGKIMWWVNQHTHDVSGPKIKYLAQDVTEDLVLMGTSRCNFHYIPSIIKKELNMSVYNGGIDASDNIYAHYIVLNHMLSHHTPKVIVLEVMSTDFEKQANPFETTTFFAPYFGHNQEADSIYLESGKYWQYKISHLYRFNAKAVSNLAGLVVNHQSHADHGYIPAPEPLYPPKQLLKDQSPGPADPLKIKYINKFINLCQAKGIKLIFVVSPLYSKPTPDQYDPLKDVAKQHNIPFLDYHSQCLFCDHPEYFRDNYHLWDKGARAYTKIFSHDLKELLDASDINK